MFAGLSAAPTFVTGATGYVGGRLVPDLLEAGYAVRCLAREPRKLNERPWRSHPNIQVVAGDLSDTDELTGQLRGCSTAYYLVHSMEATGKEYAARDRQLAANFALAAAGAGLSRIIYLGGLGEMGPDLSQHLQSRREVETELASTGVAVTTFRAAMIIGAGSASFETLRYLVERLPVMITPSWVRTECQPVAIADVLHWLVECLNVPATAGKTLEIGGPEVMPYRELMRIMAEELHLPRRIILPVPVLTPRLSSMWISLVTPVSYRIARPLAEGLRNRVVVTNDDTQRLMPHQAAGVREAIRHALQKVEANDVETRWSAAGPVPGDPHWAGGTVFTDQRSVEIDAGPHSVFAAVCRIGGGNGWYAGDLLWRLRGWMDTVVGGPGLRRGRRHPENVEFGEALDFWRVVGIERDRYLSLRAEMKLPGEAKLNFEVCPGSGSRSKLTMTALFRPHGLLGILYWYAVSPLHGIVFGGMLRGIRKTAEAMHWGAAASPANARPSAAVAPIPGYGRARLWLGISAVGTFVTLAVLALALDLPNTLARTLNPSLGAQLLGLLAFVVTYGLIQLPFDILGGYVLPWRYGRAHPPPGRYLLGLMRGAFVHSVLLLIVAATLMLAGKYGDAIGTIAAGMALALVLLRGRVVLAASVAPIELTPSGPQSASSDQIPVVMAESRDEGFTGAVVGVFRPRLHMLPTNWRRVLSHDELNVAINRRFLAVKTGSWRRGRVLTVLFTFAGLTLSALLVGPQKLGTAGGTIELSLWFTLWSFLGLLTLPTLSRHGVAEVDERFLREGGSSEAMERTIRALDDLQDGEPERPPIIESIFHPVPSVNQRVRGPHIHGSYGFWDAARTTVFLSAAGLGLLGRAVHCNCGRPALWVFLPTD